MKHRYIEKKGNGKGRKMEESLEKGDFSQPQHIS